MQELIRACGISVAKRSDIHRIIIKDVSLNVRANEIVGIVGESGSGKTTTALALTGMLPASLKIIAGSASCKNKDIYALSRKDTASFWGKETAFIFQDPSASLNPVKRIGTQIAERLVLFSKLSKSQIEARVLNACKEAGLEPSRGLLRKYPHELSGGMKQRAMIAGAIIHSPSLIIADEPTASLDAITAKEILCLIKTLQQKSGCGVVLISHDLNAVREICSRVYVMHKGSIIEDAPGAAFFSGPASEHAKRLLDAAHILAGKKPASALYASAHGESIQQKRAAAETQNLCAAYTPRFARAMQTQTQNKAADKKAGILKNISLAINEHEVFGVIGESGSGKTTLARALSGIIPYSGSYKAGGEEFAALTKKQQSRFVQIVFQNPYTSLNPAMTVQSLIEEPLVIHGADAKRERAEKAREMLDSVLLDQSFLPRYPRELSGGERQRIAIASALMLSPRLLIADEMLSALDAAVQVKILELLCRLRERFGFSVLFITHHVAHALTFCNRVAVMKDGSIIETAHAAQIAAHPSHEYTKKLLAAAQEP